MLLTELLVEERIKVPLVGRTKPELLRELVELAVRDVAPEIVDAVHEAVVERERDLSTGIGSGVAIPHGKTTSVDQLVMAAGVTAAPVDYDALDGEPVELCFLLIGPESAAGAHVKALARISRLLRRDALRAGLRASRTPAEFLDVIRHSEHP